MCNKGWHTTIIPYIAIYILTSHHMEGVDHARAADFVGKGDNHVVAALFRETHLVAGTGVLPRDGVTGGDVIGGGGALGGGDGV